MEKEEKKSMQRTTTADAEKDEENEKKKDGENLSLFSIKDILNSSKDDNRSSM